VRWRTYAGRLSRRGVQHQPNGFRALHLTCDFFVTRKDADHCDVIAGAWNEILINIASHLIDSRHTEVRNVCICSRTVNSRLFNDHQPLAGWIIYRCPWHINDRFAFNYTPFSMCASEQTWNEHNRIILTSHNPPL